MQFSESWLRSFIDPNLSSDELAHELTMAGLEVDEIKPAAPAFSNVVVAEVVHVTQHPNADRLKLCQVNYGESDHIQVVCGAPNVKAGIKVPLAKVGATLPGNFKIKKAKMRGEESHGMLCSGQELGIEQDYDGLMVLDSNLEVGQCLRSALDLDDICFTLSLTPNRPDCLSILGVAREVSALTGAPLKYPNFTPIQATIDDVLPVNIQDHDLCGRFAGRVIKGVNAKAKTPDWMVRRLLRGGQRPVSALVDISNYVMLELGRPTHIFDLEKLGAQLNVRWARKGEQIKLLNGQELNLDTNIGVIDSDGKPESLAGIMGGDHSAVNLDTKHIYLEGAFWWPEAIMGRSRQYKLESEASHRFERGVDAETITNHLERVTRLIIDICGGQAGPVNDQVVSLPKRDPVKMRLARCNRILGIKLTSDVVAKIFDSLKFNFTYADDVFQVTPPSYRFDINIEEDLIEEVARIYGFERIPDNPPVAAANMITISESRRDGHMLREKMAALDYQEVINFSFVRESWEQNYAANYDAIRLVNPIASHLAVMRSTLIGGLLDNIKHNVHHRQNRVRVFELGRVFHRDDNVTDGDLEVGGISQPTMLAAAAWGPAMDEQWGVKTRYVDFFDVKHDLEVMLSSYSKKLECIPMEHPALHPGRSAKLLVNNAHIGWIGEVHPKWVQELGLKKAPVVFEVSADILLRREFPVPETISKYPVVTRDLAIMVDASISYQALLNTINDTIDVEPELVIIKRVSLFDVWRDKSSNNAQKSMAFRFWLQSPDSTLDDATVESCMKQLLNALSKAHKASLRA